MIVEIGRWVLQEGIAALARWRASGLAKGLTISVNVSARQFREAGFADEVLGLLRAAEVPPDALIVELTEHALVDLRVSQGALTRLREAGVRVSLDDFGTGYSSLSYLKRFPADYVKIDQTFIRDLSSGGEDAAITRAIIAMAHSMELKVVAEGVETHEQLDFLRQHKCDEIQGYLISRPVPAGQFIETLHAHQASSGHA